jgi:hypothetical protein
MIRWLGNIGYGEGSGSLAECENVGNVSGDVNGVRGIVSALMNVVYEGRLKVNAAPYHDIQSAI